MSRTPVILLVLAMLSACVTPGERLIQVRADPVSDTGMPLTKCTVGLHQATDSQLLEEKDISREFISSFVNPPQRGNYYLKIKCPGRRNEFRSSTFDFAKGPYFHDLGRIAIRD
jgi:hypothetical protein